MAEVMKAANRRGRAYRCKLCSSEPFTGEKYRLEAHIWKYHVPLDRVPYSCALCMFRCTTEEQWHKHVQSYKWHKQRAAGGEASTGMRKSDHPYVITDQDWDILTKEESVEFFSQRSSKTVVDRTAHDILYTALSQEVPEVLAELEVLDLSVGSVQTDVAADCVAGSKQQEEALDLRIVTVKESSNVLDILPSILRCEEESSIREEPCSKRRRLESTSSVSSSSSSSSSSSTSSTSTLGTAKATSTPIKQSVENQLTELVEQSAKLISTCVQGTKDVVQELKGVVCKQSEEIRRLEGVVRELKEMVERQGSSEKQGSTSGKVNVTSKAEEKATSSSGQHERHGGEKGLESRRRERHGRQETEGSSSRRGEHRSSRGDREGLKRPRDRRDRHRR